MKTEISCKSALLVNSVVEFTVFSQLAFCCSFLTISTINTNYIRHFCAQSYSFGHKHLKTDTTKRPNECYIPLLKVKFAKKKPKKEQKQKVAKRGVRQRKERIVSLLFSFAFLFFARRSESA